MIQRLQGKKRLVRVFAYLVLIYAVLLGQPKFNCSTSVATNLPECLSHRSMDSDRKKETAVMHEPVTNSGLRISAPTSDI